jgi:hypothetical protein
MPRAQARFRNLHCHSCGKSWRGLVYAYTEDWQSERNSPSCGCSTPHIEILPDPRDTRYAQCRASQRAVVYQMPDGRLENPMTNAFDDPGALDCVKRGGIRREFYSVRELRQLHRDERHSEDDEWSMRNHFIDWDEPTIRSGAAMHPAKQRAYEKMLPEQSRADILLDGGARYEEVLRRLGR